MLKEPKKVFELIRDFRVPYPTEGMIGGGLDNTRIGDVVIDTLAGKGVISIKSQGRGVSLDSRIGREGAKDDESDIGGNVKGNST